MYLDNAQFRCNNHRCTLRGNCKRYLQLAPDFHADRRAKHPVARFEGSQKDIWERVIACDEQIKLKDDIQQRATADCAEL